MRLFRYRSSTLSNVGLANLAVVYVVWSSTYLAIRVGVAADGGFSPLAMGAFRLLVAGALLLGFALIRGFRIRLSKSELYALSITSILLWVVCTGGVMWAEQHANSGFAALVLATSPIVVALLNYRLLQQIPSKLLLGALIFSLAGLGLLMTPSLLSGTSTEMAAVLVLFLCAVAWSVGTVFQSHHPLDLRAIVISGYQQLIGGGIFAFLMLVLREPLPHPGIKAWSAMVYLIVFGSILAFTAFVNALNLLPINITMTYSYVNPVLALFLGWWLLAEPITGWTLLGAAMVIMGVVGVFRDRSQLVEGLEKA